MMNGDWEIVEAGRLVAIYQERIKDGSRVRAIALDLAERQVLFTVQIDWATMPKTMGLPITEFIRLHAVA